MATIDVILDKFLESYKDMIPTGCIYSYQWDGFYQSYPEHEGDYDQEIEHINDLWEAFNFGWKRCEQEMNKCL